MPATAHNALGDHSSPEVRYHQHPKVVMLPAHEIAIPQAADFELPEVVALHPMYDPTNWPLYSLRYRLRDYLAEFWGTFILLFFGNGIEATVTFNTTASGSAYLSSCFGWGMGLTMALYCSMGISGGHVNPAITFASAVFGKFAWRKVPGYIFSQLLGAFAASATVYGIFKDQFDAFDGGRRQLMGPQGTGSIWCTYPNPGNSKFYAALAEVLNTATLLFLIYSIGDDRMTPATHHLPIAIGLLLFVLLLCTVWATSSALNPARDLGPRAFSAILYGSSAFSFDGHYFWIPFCMPFVGACVGVFAYQFFVLPEPKPKKD
ncbi:aquaporin-like protein [Coemansia thaxteri]|uniref:Aquaporin-like protein n=1 Tax=Coemansia thaxteri TaxID=2663907 RepID=A0A9W8EEW5_9FUNG|nr:aquaporin-like protein [Coemansia thaxteri]KAJ2009502.1 aquaporin-like protein [Coemansia thaxteri]KAJ2473868.1 aquaporin-like protein [Coemansia sp. RSA 2322]KAJ2480495.1 aquaporin-like protein [Coemansia sp. RSA 2320]